MNFIIAVFSVRTHTHIFYNLLIKSGIKCTIIETPKQAKLSCGISVKFLVKDFAIVKKILNSSLSSFGGFFKLVYQFNKIAVVPIKWNDMIFLWDFVQIMYN